MLAATCSPNCLPLLESSSSPGSIGLLLLPALEGLVWEEWGWVGGGGTFSAIHYALQGASAQIAQEKP